MFIIVNKDENRIHWDKYCDFIMFLITVVRLHNA